MPSPSVKVCSSSHSQTIDYPAVAPPVDFGPCAVAVIVCEPGLT
jgi:hypothetical protein